MTAGPQDLTIRPITGPDELDLFCQVAYDLNEELAGDLEAGRRRAEWLWVALAGGQLVARAAWWTGQEGSGPEILDVFDVDDGVAAAQGVDIGVRLLVAAMAEVIPAGGPVPEYSRFVPPDWREQAAARRVVEDRMTAIERTGGRLLVERLRLEWRPGTPIPEPTGRLTFRPADDRAQLIALMTAVLDGTLDAHSLADLASMSPGEAALQQYEGELMGYESPREWWRIAALPDGEPVGFVIPAHNGYNPIIAYIGVTPAQRGKGYIDEILAEGTRVLAGQSVPRIRASTDLGNAPMVRAFRRNGWVNFGRTINMTWGDVR